MVNRFTAEVHILTCSCSGVAGGAIEAVRPGRQNLGFSKNFGKGKVFWGKIVGRVRKKKSNRNVQKKGRQKFLGQAGKSLEGAANLRSAPAADTLATPLCSCDEYTNIGTLFFPEISFQLLNS